MECFNGGGWIFGEEDERIWGLGFEGEIDCERKWVRNEWKLALKKSSLPRARSGSQSLIESGFFFSLFPPPSFCLRSDRANYFFFVSRFQFPSQSGEVCPTRSGVPATWLFCRFKMLTESHPIGRYGPMKSGVPIFQQPSFLLRARSGGVARHDRADLPIKWLPQFYPFLPIG